MRTLLLNATYEPVNFISEDKAIKHLIKAKAECISTWPEGFKHTKGYCFVCGNKLEFYPNDPSITYNDKKFTFCSNDCSTLFQVEPKGFLVPAILKLNGYAPRHVKKKRYNRLGVFKRDNCVCQYCYKTFKIEELTIDHVLPRALGGKTTWENCVTCCNSCNNRKADKTPQMANMKLLKKPYVPNITIWHEFNLIGEKHDDWNLYIRGA